MLAKMEEHVWKIHVFAFPASLTATAALSSIIASNSLAKMEELVRMELALTIARAHLMSLTVTVVL